MNFNRYGIVNLENAKAWRLFTIIPIGRAAHNSDLLLTDNQFVQLMDFIVECRKSKEIDVKFSCEGYVGKYESLVRDSYFFCRAGLISVRFLLTVRFLLVRILTGLFRKGIFIRTIFMSVERQISSFRNRKWTKIGQCESQRF